MGLGGQTFWTCYGLYTGQTTAENWARRMSHLLPWVVPAAPIPVWNLGDFLLDNSGGLLTSRLAAWKGPSHLLRTILPACRHSLLPSPV